MRRRPVVMSVKLSRAAYRRIRDRCQLARPRHGKSFPSPLSLHASAISRYSHAGGSTMRARPSLAMLLTVLVLSVPSRAAPATLEPLVAGWEDVFKLDWQVSERRGAPVVHGDVVNASPYTVTAVQLLVEALDAGGAIVAQKIVWATPA